MITPQKSKPGQSLADLEPELCKEWNYSKNELGPENYTRSSGQKVWWICSKGHGWETKIYNRTCAKSGCPYCSGKLPILHETDLLTLEPEICKEWNYSKNKLGPENYMRGTNRKVWWICAKNHEWEVSICNRAVQGHNCPICAGKQVLQGSNDLLTLEPEICKEWNYSKNDKGPENYMRGTNRKVWWICAKNHEWMASPNSRTNKKSGCPYCYGKYPILHETDLLTLEPELCREWNYSKNKLGPESYTRWSGIKVWWICKQGHEYLTRIAYRASKKTGCPICAGQQVLQGYNDLQTLEPELCKEWDFSKNEKGPENYTSGSNRKVWWICGEEHSWMTTITDRTNGKSGCPYCYGRYPILHETDLLTLEPELCKDWNYSKNKLGPENYARSSHFKVWWICDKNHGWMVSPNSRTSTKSGCPICAKSGTSKIEQALCASLNGISSKVPNTSESKYSNWNVDMLLGNTIIEFDGGYFHSLKGAYTRDRNKTLDLLKQGYRVIRIREKYRGCEAKPLKIKHPNYHELYWSHDTKPYPSSIPDELLDKVRDICYS